MSRKTDKKLYRDQGIVNVLVQSGFGHNTQQPFVEVVIYAADWSYPTCLPASWGQ